MRLLLLGNDKTTTPRSVSGALLITLLATGSLLSTSTLADEASDNKAASSTQWPGKANSNLPMGGVFYGNAMSGVGLQNAGIGVESSRRFRAEHSGNINSVRFNNRTLSNHDINQRCDSQGPGSVWCDCVDASLDEYTCGYTLGSSYHVGNGGKIVVELRTADDKGLPSNVVLGKTESFIPMNNQKNHYPKLRFNGSVPVTQGEIYHLVFTNLTPPGSCALTGVSPEKAASCPKDAGAMGLNGIRNINAPSTTGRHGPFLGDSAGGNFYRRKASDRWRSYDNTLSWYEVGYDDGVVTGESYSGMHAMRTARYVVEGATVALQVFTVQDASREVDGVWLNFGQTKSANGSSANVRLKDSDGKVLANGTIESSDMCREMVRDSSISLSSWCQDWGYTEFDRTVSLLELSTYAVEISAPAKAGFVLSAYRPHGYEFRNRNSWTHSRAHISRDNGSTWNDWTETESDERDLSLLFTIAGMPRQLR